jgi:hypothetical protein
MGHNVRLFAGSARVLAAYRALAPMARTFALTSGAGVLVLPLDDDLHDTLHRAYGTGEWSEGPPLLSSGDMAFAAKASERGPLAYLETSYFGGAGHQTAVVWQGGEVLMGPMVLRRADQAERPAGLWPINAALRQLGVGAHEGEDEFQSFGLGFYRSNEDIWSMAAQRH